MPTFHLLDVPAGGLVRFVSEPGVLTVVGHGDGDGVRKTRLRTPEGREVDYWHREGVAPEGHRVEWLNPTPHHLLLGAQRERVEMVYQTATQRHPRRDFAVCLLDLRDADARAFALSLLPPQQRAAEEATIEETMRQAASLDLAPLKVFDVTYALVDHVSESGVFDFMHLPRPAGKFYTVVGTSGTMLPIVCEAPTDR